LHTNKLSSDDTSHLDEDEEEGREADVTGDETNMLMKEGERKPSADKECKPSAH